MKPTKRQDDLRNVYKQSTGKEYFDTFEYLMWLETRFADLQKELYSNNPDICSACGLPAHMPRFAEI